MFGNLWLTPGGPKAKRWLRKTVESKPHAADATLAWCKSASQEQQHFAEGRISNEIFLAKEEQKILKLQGGVAQLRRKKGRYFREGEPQRDHERFSFESMIDENGRDWSPAAEWSNGLETNPLVLDEDERESLSPPDWAVSTSCQALEGTYKPVMFDWDEPQSSPMIFDSFPTPDPDNNFSKWCAHLTDSVFELTSDELEMGPLGRHDAHLEPGDGVLLNCGESAEEILAFNFIPPLHYADFPGIDNAVVRDCRTGEVNSAAFDAMNILDRMTDTTAARGVLRGSEDTYWK